MNPIVKYVQKQLFAQKGAIANRKAVDFSVAKMAERLMRNGFDPNAFKNANQVENAINQIEAPRNVQQGIKSTKSAKVFDMEGKEIDPKKGIMGGKQIPDDDLPPPGSRGGPDDIAAPIQSEDEILEKLNRENKEARRNLQIKLSKDKGYQKFKGETEEEIRKRFGLDDPEDMAQGGRAGFSKGSGLKSLFNFLNENNPVQAYKKYLESVKTRMKAGKEAEVAGEVIPIAASGALVTNQMKKVLKKMNEEQKKRIEEEAQEELRKDMKKADGGIMRLGLKEGTGMTRRTFLKILGGAMSIPIIGKFLAPMKVGKTVTKVPMIKTDNVPGKPEWFDALVNKVIMEGDDVTKKFATGERQSIHQKTLDDGSVVRVTEDIDDGAVRVEYESSENVFEDPVQLQYKKPLPDEGDPRPTAEFTTAESGPVGRSVGPDDFEIDVDEVGGTSIRDLDSDVSKLKEYATGKKPTMKELVQNIERRKRARQITEDSEAQMDSIIRRQGDADDSYYGDPDEFASGGIARLLGE